MKKYTIDFCNLFYSGSVTTVNDTAEGFIMVETNYRVYVYTGNFRQYLLAHKNVQVQL